jgi:hypothetical protein
MQTDFDAVRVRLNVTCEGPLLALSEDGAVLHLPAAQPAHRQATLAIETRNHQTLQLPARVIQSIPQSTGGSARSDHQVAIEFLELPPDTTLAVRRLIMHARRGALRTASAAAL